MGAAGRSNQRKRSAAHRDEVAEEFPASSGIDVPSEPEASSDEDDNVEEGDFDATLRMMADDQGFGSDEAEDFAAQDSDEDAEDEDEEKSEIHSSDIDGASSEEDEEDEVEDEEESSVSDDDKNPLLVRAASRSTEGQETVVDSDEEAENSVLDGKDIDRLTINDFGRDLGSWKEYRKTLPQIDAGYASDSSTEEPVNTIGNVPIEWYADSLHIGYDIDGKRIMRPATGDELDKFLDNMDNPDVFRTARDEINQQNVKLSEEEIDIIRRIQGGSIPDADYNPYEDTVEWFTSQTMQTPLTAAQPSKRGFVPSKWEHNRVMKIVRAIRQGRITRGAPVSTAPQYFDLWADAEAEDSVGTGRRQRERLAAPRTVLPTHAESYHPPGEYLPTEEEKRKWLEQDPDYRKRNFLPHDFGTLRTVPGYDRFIQERFQRCLDLYLAPRMKKKVSHLDPEELMPKLPDPRDLRPFPSRESLVYLGHTGRVRSISVDPTGMWLLSGSDDGTVRLWELITGRCAKIWDFKDTVYRVAWCPSQDSCIFAAAVGSRVVIVIPSDLCDDNRLLVSEELVKAGFGSAAAAETDDDSSLPVSWDMPTSTEQASGMHVSIAMHRTVKSVTWHRRGDYLATLTSEEGGSSVLIHQISKHKSQRPFRKLKGAVQHIKFHPTRPWFLVTTQRYVRIYNLMQQSLIKTLQPGVKWISSVDVHPQGDNVIVGSYDKKLSWFDLDLSMKPYRSIRYHSQAIRQVQFSRKFPLFATASDDGTIQVYHGMVYQDLNQNPLVVPLKILRGHEIRNSLGVLDCQFHPIQPWLLSSGADGTIRLWM
ncbi:BOP1NT-domain-containing protein [Coemansia reversa NRRL 1564]|uniref:Ribosome biogenesis protein ERB1 n=1 Tax=Coemansia reversa (strain ATCC 12441 / NRRL 1564) TaxID=763665 RepID=A0A2G5B9B5_COERN|nr:BOP1NT-domain-containing protein [Coemansia reversa NRRL 1564]|eukprot:PIA15606.1 BOP1NT-domain-containing protein [Coemansia reversa NRRL 1564]